MAISKITELHKQQMLLAVLAAMCLAVGFFVVVKPGIRNINHLQNELRQTGHKRELLEKKRTLEGKIKELETNLDSLDNKSAVLSHLATLSSQYYIELDSMAPAKQNKDSQGGRYQDFYIQMQGAGQFKQLLGFLKAVRNMHPQISVVEVQLTPRGGGGAYSAKSDSLAISILLKTILLATPNVATPAVTNGSSS